MKTIAVIAEFNPLHKGHAFFLSEARKRSGADSLIVLMSGDFVQRGEPAVWNKHVRTEAALLCGADLVLELPVCHATGSAPLFADGAVSLLDSLGVVDELWFGSEAGSLSPFIEACAVLKEEPPLFGETLQEELRGGKTFPQARSAALRRVLSERSAACPAEGGWEAFLSAPNNILGLEYCLALARRGSAIRPETLARTGGGYHETDPALSAFSATAIRRALHNKDLSALSDAFPPQIAEKTDLPALFTRFLEPDDFSLLLKVRLLSETEESLTQYLDVPADLARRIKNLENSFRCFSQFITLVKSRNLTYTHVSRALLHILLRIPKDAPETAAKSGIIRLLGLRKDRCAKLTAAIRKSGSLRLCSSKASPEAACETDLYASNLYESVYAAKTGTSFIHEYSRKVLTL